MQSFIGDWKTTRKKSSIKPASQDILADFHTLGLQLAT